MKLLILQFSVEVYENRKLKEELLKMYGMLDTRCENELISFGIFETKMTASTYGVLLDNKATLVKKQPLYLSGWAGQRKMNFHLYA